MGRIDHFWAGSRFFIVENFLEERRQMRRIRDEPPMKFQSPEVVIGRREGGSVFGNKQEREEEDDMESDKENTSKKRKVEPVKENRRGELLGKIPLLSIGWKGSLHRNRYRFLRYKKGDNVVRGIKKEPVAEKEPVEENEVNWEEREPVEENKLDWEIELPPVSSFLGGRATPDPLVPDTSPVELEYDLGYQ
ncbi:hypothetical protein L211DRAFT_854185 [Terfezia boudieri ATCC MYA-4762]|uniref:Uncharacterized protein n=1 Tax=Terfezia boudieri ATCC MYA-4762 TaxID=1051890 RepID=A0A3N4L9F9_9PEZI|nr:hypothetical protein L211DRAFT_854185 [Terfezia boudieri ATCC MYA-4762]